MTLEEPGLQTSRAAVLERFGEGPVVQEFPRPEPKPGEVLVSCRYGGICGTDLHLREGNLDIELPVVLGHEGLGVVQQIGDDFVDVNGVSLSVGDTVMWASSIACGSCVPCQTHREPTLCENRKTYGVNRGLQPGYELAGAWGDHILLRPRTTVVKLSDQIDELAAMAFACAGPTMTHALLERRPVVLGEVVVVQGSGPVGLAAAALAQVAGASRVLVLGGPSSRLKAAVSARIGDGHIEVVESGYEHARAVIADMTNGRGADLVIECTGAPSAVADGLTLARRGGDYLVVGQYSDQGDTSINPHQIVYRQLNVIGSWAFSGSHLAQYIALLPTLAQRFDLSSLIATYPLADVHTAMRHVANGAVMKAVLSMEPPRP